MGQPMLPPQPPDQTLDILKAIRESSCSRWEKRRDYEWKLSFGLWTAMAAFIAIVLSKDFKVTSGGNVPRWTGFAGLAIAIAHALYLIGIITNTLSDLEVQYWTENQMANHLKNHTGFPGGKDRPRTFWSKYNGYMQVAITAILAGAAYLATLVRFGH